MWSCLFFIKVDFFLLQTAQFNKSINLFCLVFRFNFCFQRIFCNWHNTFRLLLIIRKCFFNSRCYSLVFDFIAFDFDFVILSDLNSNLNNLVEILLISALSVDCLMCLNISLIVFKMSKSSLPWSILISWQPSSCFIAFVFLICIQYSCHCLHFHQFFCKLIVMKAQVNPIT